MERKRDFSWLKNWRVLILCGGCVFAGFLLGMLTFGSPWHLPPAWGDIPTWITAFATVGLFIGAIITAIYAARAFDKQSQEVGLLLEQHQRDMTERRIAQAARVFSGVTGDRPGRPYVKNGSDFPIFDAELWYPELGGVSGPDHLGIIVPGGTTKTDRPLLGGETIAPTVLAFRDAAGIRWIRTSDGALKEQSHAITHVSVLTALGTEVPGTHPRPPGPEGRHSLPTAFRRLDDQIKKSVYDSIMIYPGSQGILSMPGMGGIWSHQEHRVEVTSSDPHNQGVYTEEHRVHDSSLYTVRCNVWNYRDSPAYAKIIVVERTEYAAPDTPEG